MKLGRATTTGTLLLAGSLGLLSMDGPPTDAASIAGGTGTVVASALLGLTLLAWRWRARSGYTSYVRTPAQEVADRDGVYAELASVMEDVHGDEAPVFGEAAAAV
ncbi:MAG: hypothetical protein JWM98_3330 [Thermoleophilia bacterium]|nr:hypothetical protein [Thermoleophilia bacterium]